MSSVCYLSCKCVIIFGVLTPTLLFLSIDCCFSLSILVRFLSRTCCCVNEMLVCQCVGQTWSKCTTSLLSQVCLQTIQLTCSDTLRNYFESGLKVPPSHLHQMCIQYSVKFAIWLPSNCCTFATSLLTRTWILWTNFGCISVGFCPPCLQSLCITESFVTVYFHNR